jgi:hypothetical protein
LVFRSGLRRLLTIFGVIALLTTAVSLLLGALAHASLARSVADGFYVAGAAVLIGSFVLGIRGPLRAEWGDSADRPRAGLLPRTVRRSTPEERVEARLNSVALFGLGLVLVIVGGLVDPTRRVF